MFFIWFDGLDELGTGAFVQRQWRWCRLGPGSRVEGQGDLESIAALLASQADEVSLLLSARACIHLRLKVPPMSARSLRQALPFVAEEQVAESVENMHFAIGGRQGEQLNCLGISKVLLQELLRVIAEYGISPVAAYSDATLLRVREGTIGMLLDRDRALIRTTHSALEAPVENISIHLRSIIQEISDSSSELVLEVFSDEVDEIPGEFANFGAKVTPRRITHSALVELLSSPVDEINLLVAEFEPQASTQPSRTWRLPLALAASLLALLLASDLIVGMNALNRTTVLKQTSLSLVDGLQTSDEVVRLIHREQGSRSQETRDFLKLLARISRVSDAHGANLRTLSYQSGSGAVDIEVLVSDYDVLDAFSSAAENSFQEADMLGATQFGEGVRARLRLVGVGQ